MNKKSSKVLMIIGLILSTISVVVYLTYMFTSSVITLGGKTYFVGHVLNQNNGALDENGLTWEILAMFSVAISLFSISFYSIAIWVETLGKTRRERREYIRKNLRLLEIGILFSGISILASFIGFGQLLDLVNGDYNSPSRYNKWTQYLIWGSLVSFIIGLIMSAINIITKVFRKQMIIVDQTANNSSDEF